MNTGVLKVVVLVAEAALLNFALMDYSPDSSDTGVGAHSSRVSS